MKIHHSIFVDHGIADPMFSECGVQLKQETGVDHSYGTCDITEDDPRWPCVLSALSSYRAVLTALRGRPLLDPNLGDRVWTEYTDEERNRASFLEMVPSWRWCRRGTTVILNPKEILGTSNKHLTYLTLARYAARGRGRSLHFG